MPRHGGVEERPTKGTEMTRSLAEEYLLLALDDASGKPLLDGSTLDAAMAGAAVTDLTVAGTLEIAEQGGEVKAGRFRKTGVNLPSDPLLLEILDQAHGRKPKDAINHIGGASAWRNRGGSLKDQLLEQLAAEGVLTAEKRKVLGLFPTTAWKSATSAVEDEIRDRVRNALRAGVAPDAHTGALIALLSASDIVHKVFPGEDKKAVKESARRISEGDWAGEALRRSIQDIQSVMAAVILTAVIAPGVSG